MASKCDWCNGKIEGVLSKCAGCNTLVRPFFGILRNQIPSKAELERTNSIMEPFRGLDDTQRFLGLANQINSEYELPKAFRARRGKPYDWSGDDCESWNRMRAIINKWGSVPRVPFMLRLPGGGFLEIEDGNQFVNGCKLPNSLPLLDLAGWLSNHQRAGAICNWPDFLMAMSCSVREIYPMEDEDWGSWNVNNSWPGIDAPHPDIETPLGVTCPFMQFVGLQVAKEPRRGVGEHGERENLHRNAGFIARSHPDAIQGVEGVASAAWMEILEMGRIEMEKLFNLRVAPRLAVIDNRLHLIALKDGRPGLVHVTVDPEIWRVLVSWSLEPEGSPGARLMRDLFYTWNSVDEELVPTKTQMKSAKLLRNNIEMLGECSSTEPIYFSDVSTGIHVEGASGMHYLVIGTDDPYKFAVESFPQKQYLADVDKYSLGVCIDPRIKHPAGDVAAAYLLALSNDVESRGQIGTLDTLLNIFEEAPTAPSSVEGWWKVVLETHELIIEHEYDEDEDYDEEDEDLELFDEIVDEPNPEMVVQERPRREDLGEEPVPLQPQPERYEILVEMFEEAMRMGMNLGQNEEEVV